jgi:drug/metabolite transporter (DMT)-like permease
MLAFCLCFGFSFIVLKELLNNNFPIFLMLAIRFTAGGVIILVLRQCRPHPPWDRPTLFMGVLVGLAIFAAYVFQTYGLKYTTPAKNGLFTGLYVIYVPIIVMLIRRKLSWKPILAALLSFGGVAVISGALEARIDLSIGDILTMGGALAFAVQLILLELHAPSLHALNFSVVQLFTVAGAAVLLSLLTESAAYDVIIWDNVWLPLLFLSVFCTGLAFAYQTHVQSKISASILSVIFCSESIFAVVFSVLFRYDVFSSAFILGSALMVAAMFAVSVGQQPQLLGLEKSKL